LLWTVGEQLLKWRVERPPAMETFEAQLVEWSPPSTSARPMPSLERQRDNRDSPRKNPVVQAPTSFPKQASHAAPLTPEPTNALVAATGEVTGDPPRSALDHVQPQAMQLTTGRIGPRAIFSPLPGIPDELREEVTDIVALVRFHVAADGGVTVELIRPSSNPLVNRILLKTLSTWRFFPAMENGQPVAAVQDLRVYLEVK
jgi:protein TonB